MLRVIFGVKRFCFGFYTKTKTKHIYQNTARIQAENPWPVPAIFHKVLSPGKYTLWDLNIGCDCGCISKTNNRRAKRT